MARLLFGRGTLLMADSDVTRSQRDLMARMAERVRWLKRRYRYRGSKETADMVQSGMLALAKSPHYGEKLRECPGELQGLAHRVMHNVLIDDIRREGRASAPNPRGRVTFERSALGVNSSLDRRLDEERRREKVEVELLALEAGETRSLYRNPGPMVAAWRLRREGMTDAAVAERLGVAKPTVNKWIRNVQAHLALRLGSRPEKL